jgi:hypothetical protein
MSASMSAVALNIDRLVLTGLEVTPDASESLRLMIEEEVAARCRPDGWPSRSWRVDRLSFEFRPPKADCCPEPRALANQIAHELLRALERLR